MKLIDLSLTIDNECITCNTPWHEKVEIKPLGKIETVGRNTSTIVFGSHTATHMDAPIHFLNGTEGIDQVDLDLCIGEVTCVNLTHIKAGGSVKIEDLKNYTVSKRMLFVFHWYKNWKTKRYYDGFPYFEEETVDYLIENGMKFMALDTPSPDSGKAIGLKSDSPNHLKLLRKKMVIVEYLTNTIQIDFLKKHKIMALPLKIKDIDGSPARVVLEEE